MEQQQWKKKSVNLSANKGCFHIFKLQIDTGF